MMKLEHIDCSMLYVKYKHNQGFLIVPTKTSPFRALRKVNIDTKIGFTKTFLKFFMFDDSQILSYQFCAVLLL